MWIVKMSTYSSVFFHFPVAPVSVDIVAKKESVSAGRLYRIECESSGSRPAAVVTWYRNKKFLGKTDSKVRRQHRITKKSRKQKL
jgi:hypothetical protein